MKAANVKMKGLGSLKSNSSPFRKEKKKPNNQPPKQTNRKTQKSQQTKPPHLPFVMQEARDYAHLQPAFNRTLKVHCTHTVAEEDKPKETALI